MKILVDPNDFPHYIYNPKVNKMDRPEHEKEIVVIDILPIINEDDEVLSNVDNADDSNQNEEEIQPQIKGNDIENPNNDKVVDPAKNEEVKSFYFNGRELFKYTIIGTSIVFLGCSVLYLVDNPQKINDFLNSINDINRGLSTEVQICVICVLLFSLLTFMFFLFEKTSVSTAQKIVTLIRNSFIADKSLVVYESDIVNNYSVYFNVDKYYFIQFILPEIKKLSESDQNISITRQLVSTENEDFEMENWTWVE